MLTTVSRPKDSTVDREKVNLFVYGTLKEGFRAHSLLQPCEVVAKGARVPGKMYTQDCQSFPMVIPCEDEGREFVVGDVYKIEKWMLQRIDRYEGHPYLFIRQPIGKILTASGNWVNLADSSYMYVYNAPDQAYRKTNFVHIPSGIWNHI